MLADVESIPADIRQAVINNGGGHLNHALFWELMTPEQTAPSAELAAAIDATFGSFEDFKQPSQQQQRHVWFWLGMVGCQQRRQTRSDFNSKPRYTNL